MSWMALLLLLALLGRLSGHCLGRRTPASGVAPSRWASRVEESWLALVAGFGLLSTGFFVLAHLGRLTTLAVVALVALSVTGCAARCLRRGVLRGALAALPLDLALATALAATSLLFGILQPPLDTTLAASDSSVYLGTAHHLARQGPLRHRDPLVAEMTVEERGALFRNRFEGDHTGPWARFPGGVVLLDPAGSDVGFHFYHLFPTWLAVGLKTVGSEHYLRLMGFFACLGLGSLFLVGRRLGGTALALAVCVVHASFYPQVFFSRFPMSEVLAQALFLSGLGALLRGFDSDEGEPGPYPLLAGLSWGALCLCRVDALPFLLLGLTLMSVLPARTGVRAKDWATPMLTVGLLGSLAVYHQLLNGARYDQALPRSGLADLAVAAAVRRPWLSPLVVAVLVGAGAFVLRGRRAEGSRLLGATKGVGIAASAATLAVFLARLDGSRVALHALWIAMYTTPAVLLLLCAGVGTAVAACARGRSPRGVTAAAALLGGPLLCYLVDPMVVPLQPWAMRRFLPLVFPLLFLLALSGWQTGLGRLLGRRYGLAAFAGLAAMTAVLFARTSAGLTSDGAAADAGAQVSALARAIPRDALVVIPDSDADLHVQVALEYRGGRDVLLLPLADGSEAGVEKAMAGLLARRLAEGRRVCLLLAKPGDLAGPLARHFQVDFLLEQTVSFARVELVPHSAFPPTPETALLRTVVAEVRPPGEGRSPSSILVGDVRQDLGFLEQGFHAPEVEAHPGQPATPFRWTGSVATMAFPPVAAITLILDTSRPPRAAPAGIEVDLDGVPVPVSTGAAGVHRVRVPFGETGLSAKRIVRLRTNAFRMRDLGLSADARELGVRVISVEIEPRSEAAAPSRLRSRTSAPPPPRSAASGHG